MNNKYSHIDYIIPVTEIGKYRITYHVDKFWRVKELRDDDKVILYTRTGKEHECDVTDPRLVRPGIIARFTAGAPAPNCTRTIATYRLTSAKDS